MTESPLFLLQTVLFPGGRLSVRVFEKRYVDMVTGCMKTDRPFGICLIKRGNEVGNAAEPQEIGTLAHVVQCDIERPGILNVVVRGSERFRLQSTRVQKDQLLLGSITLLPEVGTVIAPRHDRLVGALKRVLAQAGEEAYFGPPQLEDGTWVSGRLAELLPLPMGLKQALLELDDINMRLDVLAELFPPASGNLT
jgi:uncharacterized protein